MNAINNKIQRNVSLKKFNSFGFDVVANYFIEIQSVNDIISLISNPIFKEKKHLILSGGCNILFQNDFFDGLIIYVNNKGIEISEKEDNQVIIKAQAGEEWKEFVKMTVNHSFYGLENLSHVPGKVGASPVQNIGAYGVEVKDTILYVHAINLSTGKKRIFSKDECQFGYRNSIFKNELKNQYIIYAVEFLLKKNSQLNLQYGNIQSFLTKKSIQNPTLIQLSEAICEIRDEKLPNLEVIGNAGSFFKNPLIDSILFENLKSIYPQMPSYPDSNGKVKIPAGWLIEHAGWKGFRQGDVGVYEKQALVLVNFGSATGKEIVALSKKIQESIKDKFGIFIETEVNFV